MWKKVSKIKKIRCKNKFEKVNQDVKVLMSKRSYCSVLVLYSVHGKANTYFRYLKKFFDLSQKNCVQRYPV